MRSFNIHEAKTQLSRLVEQAADGEPFIIAKAGKPRVQVCAIAEPSRPAPQRLGFMAGEFTVPDDFNTLGQESIVDLFDAKS